MISARHLLLVAALILCGTAQATVYRCTDEQGRTTYTNDRSAGSSCVPLSRDLPVSTVPSSTPAAAPASTPRPAAGSSSFPRVTPETQRARDDSRRQLLQEELKAEENSLAEARQKLQAEEERDAPEDRNARVDGRSTINQGKRNERLQPYRNQVELHERNIEALNKELSRLR